MRSKWAFIIILTLSLVMITPVTTGKEQDCESCHESPRPSGNYIMAHPNIIIEAPTRISGNMDFALILGIEHCGDYDIHDLQGTVTLSLPNIVSITGSQEMSLKKISRTSGESSLQWEMHSQDSDGIVTVKLNVEYTAYYDHTGSDGEDSFIYTRTLEHDIEVKQTPLEPSIWSFALEAGKVVEYDLGLAVSEGIQNVVVDVDPEMSDWVQITSSDADWSNGFQSIPDGQIRTITIMFTVPTDTTLEGGNVRISWNIQGAEDEILVPVTIIHPPSTARSGGQGLHLAGRITGLLSLGLLVLAMFTGGVGKGMKKVSTRVFGTAKKRVDFHCAISYEILALSIFHGVVLWAGPYHNVIGNDYIMLGTLSTIFMGIISLNGIFQKRLVRLFGRRIWRAIHLLGSIAALALALVHGFTIGTDIGLL